jgi:DNA-directed RNA polymerase subunit RPC12/RpoP
MNIANLKNLSEDELRCKLEQGGRFVVFRFCVSVIVITIMETSDVYYFDKNQSTFWRSLPFTLISIIFGWWGIPWGPIRTFQSIIDNFRGGKDVTNEVLSRSFGVENPLDYWSCPKCGYKNKNTNFICNHCNYRII